MDPLQATINELTEELDSLTMEIINLRQNPIPDEKRQKRRMNILLTKKEKVVDLLVDAKAKKERDSRQDFFMALIAYAECELGMREALTQDEIKALKTRKRKVYMTRFDKNRFVYPLED